MGGLTRRGFGLFAGAGGLALGAGPALAAAAGEGAAFDIMPYVHPELRGLAGMLAKMKRSPITAETLPAARAAAAVQHLPLLAQPAFEERTIPGPKGAPDVRVYVVNAGVRAAPRPAILHMHGGGFIVGAAKGSMRQVQEVALALDCVIVSVDYRLAPETRFPGSLEDNYAGLRWLNAHADELGVDRSRIAVMGESAGGGHAAMLAIAARDRGEFKLAYQALVYPMLDDRTGSVRKTPPYQGVLIWTPEQNAFGWSALLGAPAGAARVPYGAVPARVTNLRGLPPAFIGVGSIDLFVDEDIEYARRLVDAGVPTTLDVVPGAFHGFDVAPGAKVSQQFKAALVAALAQGLGVTWAS